MSCVRKNISIAVRHAAFDAIVDIVQGSLFALSYFVHCVIFSVIADQNESDFIYLLEIIEDFTQLPSLRFYYTCTCTCFNYYSISFLPLSLFPFSSDYPFYKDLQLSLHSPDAQNPLSILYSLWKGSGL